MPLLAALEALGPALHLLHFNSKGSAEVASLGKSTVLLQRIQLLALILPGCSKNLGCMSFLPFFIIGYTIQIISEAMLS